jgi:ANTAR domain
MDDSAEGAPFPADELTAARAGEGGPRSTVERLRAEVDSLRRALRGRAVIEQATGLLAGRHGCGLSAAFKYLNQLAQDTDTALIETATLLIGETVPVDTVPADIAQEGKSRISSPRPRRRRRSASYRQRRSSVKASLAAMRR